VNVRRSEGPDERPEERDDDLAELLAEVRRIDVQSHRLVDELIAGGYSSVFRGSGIEFDSVREYVEGDDPRAVDWNVTARMGRPFIKTYVDERELTMLFLLDLSESMSGGFGPWSARQIAARVCACLALSAVRSDDKVGLIAFGHGVEKYVPAKKGAGHALRIIRDVLALRSTLEGTDLAPALSFASRVVRRRATLFIVSDFLTDGWRDALARCARRHDVVAIRLLTPELHPPAPGDLGRGLMRLRDPESGHVEVVDWSGAAVRRTYSERIAAWRERTADELRRVRVDLMDVPVPVERIADPVAGPILRFFRMREKRGAKR